MEIWDNLKKQIDLMNKNKEIIENQMNIQNTLFKGIINSNQISEADKQKIRQLEAAKNRIFNKAKNQQDFSKELESLNNMFKR